MRPPRGGAAGSLLSAPENSEEALVIHSDRGSSMTSAKVSELFSKLGITGSLNRPHVSNDNAFSESQFKTMKYGVGFPRRFGSLEQAKEFCRAFFDWYNHAHYHSGLAYLIPAKVHGGGVDECLEKRQKTLTLAFEQHPERFVKGQPTVKAPPAEVWINRPKPQDEHTLATDGSITIIGGVR